MQEFVKPLVFINYRRADAQAEAGRLAGDLERAFGDGYVFQDVEDIQGGDRWIDALVDAGIQSKVILALIGPNWLQMDEHGISRLDDPEDWVRKELESAINQGKTIIPITVDNSEIPLKTELPDSLKPLLAHQAFDIRTSRWRHDVELLVKQLAKLTDAKPIAKDRLKRLLKIARFVGLLSAPLLLGFFAYTFMNNQQNYLTEVGPTAEPVYMPPPIVTSKPPIETMDNNPTEYPGISCPNFDQESELKTMLYPFTRVDGGQHNIGALIQQRISRLCDRFNVRVDIGIPITQEGTFTDIQDARKACALCKSDIFLTGLAFASQSGNFNIQADFGFCYPVLNGITLNEDLLKISVTDIPIEDISSDKTIERSIEHVLQIYLGFYFAKEGELEKSNQILNDAVEQLPINDKIKTAAYKIIWQNDYKLGNKEQCIITLDKLSKLNPTSNKTITTSSIIAFELENYNKAIQGFSHVIKQTIKDSLKTKLIEKRGDAYFKSDQLIKAKDDYKRIGTTPHVLQKIRKVDAKIIKNESTISNLTSNIASLSSTQQLQLIELEVQNGKHNAAKKHAKLFQVESFQNNSVPLSENTIRLINSSINN